MMHRHAHASWAIASLLVFAAHVMAYADPVLQHRGAGLRCISLKAPRPVGPHAQAISGDGRVVAYMSSQWLNGEHALVARVDEMVTLVELETGRVHSIGAASGHTFDRQGVSLSHDGSRLAIRGSLWPDPSNGPREIFTTVFDVNFSAGTNQLVASIDEGPDQGLPFVCPPSITADGGRVLVRAGLVSQPPGEDDLMGLAWRELATGAMTLLPVDGIADELPKVVRASADGSVVVFERSRLPTLDDLRAFQSDLLVWRSANNDLEEISSQPLFDGFRAPITSPAVSADGTFLAFLTFDPRLVDGDTNGAIDVFVRELATGRTHRASVSSQGEQVDRHGTGPLSLSADGRFVAFRTHGQGLVSDDVDQASDVFVHDRESGKSLRANVSLDGTSAGTADCGPPTLSADGRMLVFSTTARLVPEDTNDWLDVYVRWLDWE